MTNPKGYLNLPKNPTPKKGIIIFKDLKKEILTKYPELNIKSVFVEYLIDAIALLLYMIKKSTIPPKIRFESAKFWIEYTDKLQQTGKLDVETIGELRKWITLYTNQYQQGRSIEHKQNPDVIEQ